MEAGSALPQRMALPSSVSNWYYVGCFCVTVASVLGTGILALPVKTANSGFWPFFVMFVLVLVFEEAVILYAIDIMQRARYLNSVGITTLEELRELEPVRTKEPLFAKEKPTTDDQEDEQVSAPLIKGEDKHSANVELNLHNIGKLFLGRGARIVFDLCVYVHFVSILISYVIAASESWGKIFKIEVTCGKEEPAQPNEPISEQDKHLKIIIVVFGIVCTLLLIFGQKLFTSVVSVMTGAKGGLLVLMVVVTAVVAAELDLTITTDWEYTVDTFLMSTVALGGAVNLAPLIFDKVPQTKTDVKKFRFSVLSALAVCSVLVLSWTYFVMKAVPQTAPPNSGEPNLREAADAGCISTIPLTEVISRQKKSLVWIADVVDYFIMISVTISFITVGSGLKNFLDGYVATLSDNYPLSNWNFGSKIAKICTTSTFYRIILYTFSYGLSVGFAVGKPSCFLVILEYLTSMALNLENGAFIAYMAIVAANFKITSKIPLPIGKKWGLPGAWTVGGFFMLTVFFGIGYFIYNAIESKGDIC